MENKKKKTTVNVNGTKQKKKMSKGGIVLLVGIIIILIPVLIFGGILLSAALETGTPVEGSRFTNDLEPAISDSQTSSLETSIKAISGVEDCTIVLKSAQYRINVDTVDSLSDSEVNSLTVEVYNAVNSALPVSTYFTATDSMKMYDLAINVYTQISEPHIYYLLTKNSNMDTYSIQCVSEAVNEDLASELRGENVSDSEAEDETTDGDTTEE